MSPVMPDGYSEALADLESRIRQAMLEWRIPAVSLAVTSSNSTLLSVQFGYSDLPGQQSVGPNDLFQIGSLGKSFAAILILQLVEEGLVDLDVPVVNYLPWFQVQSRFPPITVRSLLSHTGGIISGSIQFPDARSEVWALRETETGTSPGEYYHYSNDGYEALGLVISEVLGRPYWMALTQRVLRPLGMEQTSAVRNDTMRHRCAQGHVPARSDIAHRPGNDLVIARWFRGDAADGAICSNADDMAKYARFLANQGVTDDGTRLMTRASYEAMTTPQVDTPGEPTYDSYGLGVGLFEEDGRQLIRHNGGTIGFRTAMICDPTQRIGVVVMLNGPAWPEGPNGIAAEEIAAAILTEMRYQGSAHSSSHPFPVVNETVSISDYVGEFAGDAGTVTISARGGTLIFDTPDGEAKLEARGHDQFYVLSNSKLEGALLECTRDRQGRVTELFHGSRWFRALHYQGPASYEIPEAWTKYPGLYWSHSPWGGEGGMRVVIRRDGLLMIDPITGMRTQLTPLSESTFVPGGDPRSPERVTFQTVVDGRTLHLRINNAVYYRCFNMDPVWGVIE